MAEVAPGDSQVLQLDAVEPGGEVAQGVVTPLADVGDDLPDGLEGLGAPVGLGARQGLGEFLAGAAAKVETGEHR